MTSPGRQRPVDTPRACYYADDPVRRPRCTLTERPARRRGAVPVLQRGPLEPRSSEPKLGLTRQGAQQPFARASKPDSTTTQTLE